VRCRYVDSDDEVAPDENGLPPSQRGCKGKGGGKGTGKAGKGKGNGGKGKGKGRGKGGGDDGSGMGGGCGENDYEVKGAALGADGKPAPLTVVFCATRHHCEFLSALLGAAGLKATTVYATTLLQKTRP